MMHLQVVMTEQLATQHSEVHFSVMHPGWADTPAVRTSMPDFYAKVGYTSVWGGRRSKADPIVVRCRSLVNMEARVAYVF